MKKQQLIVIPAYQPLESLVPLTEEIFTIFENVLVIDDGGKDKYALMRLGLIPQYTQRWKTNNTLYLEFVFPNAP